uniref:Myb/SANT-like domain-containing protein n=1 Tax=Setaria viridis TaxID=4556 RepID=A0A4U6UYX3_SETVI|nr:hypothetical protein SEVIR_4G152100v2 [Setaria viridis]
MENKGKGKGKSNETEKIVCQADWENPAMTTIFCNIVVEEIEAGNRPHGHLKSEKKAFRYTPPPCLKQWEIMFEKSHVSGHSTCIPGEEGGGDSIPNEEERDDDQIHEMGSDQFTPTSSTRTELKRKVKSSSSRKISPRKKGKNPMVWVMSRMVDDVISSNFVTSKVLIGDFTCESIREVMALVKECGAVEGSDEHYIATQLFKHSANREFFLSSFDTNEGRFNWLKRCYEERKT